MYQLIFTAAEQKVLPMAPEFSFIDAINRLLAVFFCPVTGGDHAEGTALH